MLDVQACGYAHQMHKLVQSAMDFYPTIIVNKCAQHHGVDVPGPRVRAQMWEAALATDLRIPADFAERRKAHAAGERAQRGAAAGAGLARVARPALFAGAAAAAARARPAAEHEQDAARADGAALCACGSAQGRELFASEQLATFGVEGERAREKPLAWRRAKGPRRQPPRGEQLPAFSRISCRRVLMGA